MHKGRVIPPGKLLRAEYGQFDRNDLAHRTVLDEAYAERVRAPVTLVRVSPGFQLAGSVAVWTNGYVAVWWTDRTDGARHGRQFNRQDQARAHFDKLTNKDG